MASPGPTVLPKWADGLYCAAGVGRCTSTWFSLGRRQRLLPRLPDGGVGLNAHYIFQSELREVRAELSAFPIARICQHHSHRNLSLDRLPNLLQGNFWLGLKPNPIGNARLSTAFGILTPHLR